MLWWVASRVKQQWTRDPIGLQAQGWVSFRGYPLVDCFQSSCMQKEGFQVFYQGLGTCLAQAAYLVNGAIFSTWICHWDSHDHVHLKNPNQFWAQSNTSITKAWPSRQAKSSSYSLDALNSMPFLETISIKQFHKFSSSFTFIWCVGAAMQQLMNNSQVLFF
jgi:hypothetical protein